MKNLKVHIIRLSLIGICIAVWEILSARNMIDRFFFSQPSKIILDLWEMITNGSIFFHAGVTLQEAFIGFLLGAILGILMAYLIGQSSFLTQIFGPVLMVLYGTPRIALAPLFILWFGLGLASKIIFAFSLVFFLVFFNTFAGLRDVNKGMVESIRVMGASKRQILLKVIFPSVIPWILAGLRSGIGMSLLGAIIGEYVGGNAGLGWLINYSTNLFLTTRVFSCLLFLAILVTLMNEGLNRLEQRLLKWRPLNNKF